EGTTKPRTTGRPLSSNSSVLAHTTMTSETGEVVIHIFAPLRIQSDPSLFAVVFMHEGSDPTTRTVRPKQPIALPVAIFGSHSSFCASEPKRWMANIASDPCTDTSERRPESTASSSRQARPYWVAVDPPQP